MLGAFERGPILAGPQGGVKRGGSKEFSPLKKRDNKEFLKVKGK